MRALVLMTALAAVVLWLGQRDTLRSQERPTEDRFEFRITVGHTDREPKQWTGRLAVTGGDLARLQGWRYTAADRAGADGSFDFQTRVGPLENQLRATHPYGQTDWNDPEMRRVMPNGLVAVVRGSEASSVSVDAAGARFEFRAADVPYGRRMAALNGNAVVERMPVETLISEKGATDDSPSLAIAADGTPWVAWLSYTDAADEVVAGSGGKLYRITGKGDHHAPTIASDGGGKIHAVWSQNDNGVFQLFTAVSSGAEFGGPQRLTADTGNNLWPRLASDGKGKLALAWQGIRRQQSVILMRTFDGSRWSEERMASEGAGNAWTPSAAYGGGKLWIAWDSYTSGAYQVYARAWGESVERVTRGENFSVRPSIAVTPDGRPVVAWEESDALWGKDFAFLTDRRGTPLYKNRRVRVAYRDGANWREIAAPLADAAPAGIRRYMQQPEVAIDSGGRLYVSFRSRTSASTARIDNWASGGRWECFLASLDGDRWTEAVPLPSSAGRNSMSMAVAIHRGRVHLAWPTDARAFPAQRYGDLDIYTAALPASSGPAKLSGGRTIETARAAETNAHPNEAADTRRIRAYRANVAGKQYRILRGDLHRHTELSNDGAGDGSLDDLYRYALDAAAMDYAHVGDHQMGTDERYNWWITQKSNDLYHIPQRFVVLYGYERSVWWPNGHRNVIWAERGKPVLSIGPAEAKGAADSGPILYPYLRETKGIVTSHTSATEQGTDWRDNDPLLEPLVEIYQGFESSYEHAGAPRAWKEGMRPVHQGLRPLGFIWNAWAKGYKLGVQASSDHVSTHTSYAMILAEEHTRAGLLDAMRKRHAYAATDQIVVDYRIRVPEGEYLMGDIIETRGAPTLVVKIIGTAAIRQIDVVKNNTYVHKLNPNQREASFEYVDRSSAAGESYYYVRAEQTDGQLAWSSPIWVRRRE